MHQRAAPGVRMQNNQQQRKGPNQRDRLLGMSRRKSCIPDWRQQLKLSIHHVFHTRKKQTKNLSPDLRDSVGSWAGMKLAAK